MSPWLARKIRVILATVIAVCATAVLVNYFSKKPFLPGAARPGEILDEKVTRLTRGFEHTDYRKGVPQYKLSAGRSEERLDRVLLKDGVQLQRYSEGKPSEALTSREAQYELATRKAEFSKQVVLKLLPEVEIHAETLEADMARDLAAISSTFQIRGQKVSGHGRHLIYDIGTQKMEILKGFSIGSRAEPNSSAALHLEGKRATFLLTQSLVLVEGGGTISRGQDRLTAPLIRLWLTAGPRRTLQRLEAEKGARLERAGDAPSAVEGERIVFHFSPDQGKALRVEVFSGNTRARWSQPDGQSLCADTLTALLSDDQKIQKLEARQNVVLQRSEGTRQTEIVAHALDAWIEPATGQLQRAELDGAVSLESRDGPATYRAQAPSARLVFTAGRSSAVEASGPANGLLQDGRSGIREFSAQRFLRLRYDETGRWIRALELEGSSRVEASSTSDAVWMRSLQADRLSATLRPDTSIETFHGEGQVRVDYISAPNRKPYSISDQISGEFENKELARRIQQTGNFRYFDDALEVRGDQAVYNGTEDRITVTTQKGVPQLRREGNQTSAREIHYWPKTERAHLLGTVRTEVRQKLKADAAGRVAGEPLLITAPELKTESKAQEAMYLGGVRASRGENSTRSQTLRIFQEGDRLLAEGEVQSVLFRINRRGQKQRVQVESERLEYFQKENRAVYQGRARMRSEEALLQSDSLVAFFNERQHLERAISEGHVEVTAPGRAASGDRAEYFAEEEKIVLTGRMAHVTDSQKGKTQGRRLTLYLRDDSLLIEGSN